MVAGIDKGSLEVSYVVSKILRNVLLLKRWNNLGTSIFMALQLPSSYVSCLKASALKQQISCGG